MVLIKHFLFPSHAGTFVCDIAINLHPSINLNAF